MRVWQNIPQLFLVGAIATVFVAAPAFAQRSEGRGRGGQGKGQSRSGPAEVANRGGNSSARSSTGATNRRQSDRQTSPSQSSNKQSMRQTYRQGENDAPRQFRTHSDERRQTFFRGPNFDQSDLRRRDRDLRDGRGTEGELESRFRDRDQNTLSGDWRDRVFNDDRDMSRQRSSFRRDDWSQTANRIRNDWRRRDRDNLPFRYGWWDSYVANGWPVFSPWQYSRWRDRPYYWWRWTAAPRLTSWLVFGWNRPYYWDYGPGGNIFYRNDYVYYDHQQYLPANQYYQQVYELAHSVPTIDQSDAERMEWSPLGVFAATRDGEEPQRTLQLAVSKQGVLTGTYYNTQNGHVHPLAGMVDDRTQRAAWAFADGDHPDLVFETSIYNLTQPETSMLVHFGPSESQAEVWHLVRLERPESSVSELPAPRSAQRSELP